MQPHRPCPVIVVSHERSGTHFLMNALELSCGYVAVPWTNLDQPTWPVDFSDPLALERVLTWVAVEHPSRVVKSHHHSAFFLDIIDRVLSRHVVLYVHRHPVDVMVSFWRFIHAWRWHEGPRCADPVAFARAAPEGHLLRYQLKQHRNMLERWASHIEGWHRLSEGRSRLRMVPYDRLRDDYPGVMRSLAGLLDAPLGDLVPPTRQWRVIEGAPLPIPTDLSALRELARGEVGATMATFGYD